jgi:hypothetical protein
MVWPVHHQLAMSWNPIVVPWEVGALQRELFLDINGTCGKEVDLDRRFIASMSYCEGSLFQFLKLRFETVIRARREKKGAVTFSAWQSAARGPEQLWGAMYHITMLWKSRAELQQKLYSSFGLLFLELVLRTSSVT